jgi:hypothetical protein
MPIPSPTPVDVLGFAPATWDALATIVTALGLVLAGIGAIIAARQYRSGELARREQDRPFVLVSVQPSEVDEPYLNLVIENAGNSPANDVRIDISPAL